MWGPSDEDLKFIIGTFAVACAMIGFATALLIVWFV